MDVCGQMRCEVGGVCGCAHGPSTIAQSLDEMQFGRGLWTAAKDGETDRLRTLLTRGSRASATDASGYSPLHYASRNNHPDACRILLLHGASVNATTPHGSTALHRAAYMGLKDVISVLLEYGADPTLRDSDGMTALHKVAQSGSLDALHALTANNPSKVRCWWCLDNRGRSPQSICLAVHPSNLQLLAELTTPYDLLVSQFFAFAMGSHRRLGHSSPVSMLPHDMLQRIGHIFIQSSTVA
eukprot:c27906_g1_i1.p1 GENE.c27906_g1_i1~~c27906_g1_i1.p1  ORF type:complete len:251 (+),score=22.28 c27906_g1_i1:32-754(+)